MPMFDTTSLIVEKCEETGLYVGYLPNMFGVHSQAETLDELHHNLQEVIDMLAEDDKQGSIDELLQNK